MMLYRVHMFGRSMTANYSGYIDVSADDEEDAERRAKRKLTGPRGTFFDWSPSMFRVAKIECIGG